MQLTLYTCRECDASLSHDNPRYITEQLCPACAHWLYRATNNDPRAFRASGHAYVIGKSTDHPKGYSGRKWEVRFFDGQVIQTDSLWDEGNVPAWFRDRLPDTADLIGLQS